MIIWKITPVCSAFSSLSILVYYVEGVNHEYLSWGPAFYKASLSGSSFPYYVLQPQRTTPEVLCVLEELMPLHYTPADRQISSHTCKLIHKSEFVSHSCPHTYAVCVNAAMCSVLTPSTRLCLSSENGTFGKSSQ